MSSPAHRVAAYLAAQGQGTLGTDAFVNYVPPSPDVVLVVTDTGGLAAADDFTSGIDRPTVQLRFRSTEADPAAVYARAIAAYNLLHRLAGVAMGGVRLIEAVAIQPPTFIGRDQSRRPEWTFNVALNFERTRVYGG